MILSKGAGCDSKKLSFIKEHEANGLLSNLGLRNTSNEIFLLVDTLF